MRGRILTGLLVLWAAGPALAGGAAEQRVAGHEGFAAGSLDGLTLHEDGIVRPGYTLTTTALDVPTAWAGLDSAGATWIGTGNDALVLRVDAGTRKVTRIETGDGGLMVTALAALPDEAVAAAVYPGGRVVRLAKDGTVNLIAKLPVEFVWALAADNRGGLTAACGAPGAIFHIDPFGAVDKLADTHDEHARCMVKDRDRLLVGTAPKGLVLEWKDEKLRVLRDLAPQEVVGIVAQEDGSLIVAANQDQVGGNAQQLATLLKQVAQPRKTNANQKPAERAALQDGRILHLTADGGTDVLWEQKKTAVLCLAAHRGGAIAGTHPNGHVLSVVPGAAAAVLADVDESEVSVLLGTGMAATAPVFVTSNPAVLHTTSVAADRGGTWTSAPLDPGARAQWGTLRVWGRGIAAAHFRYGETQEPDGTWTPWTPSGGFDGERGATGATARYLQVRMTLAPGAADAELRAIEVVRRTPNAAPKISDLKIADRKPDPKTGMRKATPIRKFEWKAEDADEDRLRTTLRVRRDGSPRWVVLLDGEILSKPNFSWDTTGWPDGRYRVELLVSDAPDNATERARETKDVLPSVQVDNTPPRVVVNARSGEAGQVILSGEADDGAQGRLRWVRVSVSGTPWRQLAARDGLFDSNTESFDATLQGLEQGSHDVVVQVADTEGNVGSTAVVVEVR